MYDSENAKKPSEDDKRFALMERFVGLDQARLQAQRGMEENSQRLTEIREEMATLRRELRSVIDMDADDVPREAAITGRIA